MADQPIDNPPEDGIAQETDHLRLVLQNEASEFMARGLRAYSNQDFENAVNYLSQGVSLIEQVYGSMSVITGEALFSYGRALLENGVKNTTLLGDKQPSAAPQSEEKPKTVTVESDDDEYSDDDDDEDDDDEGDELRPDLRGKFFSFRSDIDFELEKEEIEADNDDDDDDDDSGHPGKSIQPVSQAKGDEEATEAEDGDFALAWQSLDTARLIFSRHLETSPADSDRFKHKLGEVLLALGDVSLESENFTQAIIDYEQAVEVKRASLEAHDRKVAEAIYKLAVAYEYLPDRIKAQEQLNNVTQVLQTHITTLDSEKDATSIKEINELLSEIRLKIEDMNAPQPDLVPELAKDWVAQSNSGFEGPQENARNVNTLVKRKVPSSDDQETANIKKTCP